MLQWWDPCAKRNLSTRVDGDLVAAIMRARQIDERLVDHTSSGLGRRRIAHGEIVDRFKADLAQRAEAEEIDPRTVARYSSALEHYVRFTEQSVIRSAFPSATSVNREFAQKLSAYLSGVQISPNGHPHSKRRKMASPRYVEDVCRSMFAWASDPERGNLLGEGFRNPFAGKGRKTTTTARDLFGEPDITLDMATAFLENCDWYQLSLFSLLVFYGLRASEPCFLFHENITDDGCLKIHCDPALAYVTKGRRDKRVPLLSPLSTLLQPPSHAVAHGPLILRRKVWEGVERPPMFGCSLSELHAEFSQGEGHSRNQKASDRINRRNRLLRDAGAIGYDQIEHEFRHIANRLGWPSSATLKDFRHLFASTPENAGVPEFYRRYFMGQSPGKAAIVTYTHLNELRSHYQDAVDRRFKPLLEVVVDRAKTLGEALPKK